MAKRHGPVLHAGFSSNRHHRHKDSKWPERHSKTCQRVLVFYRTGQAAVQSRVVVCGDGGLKTSAAPAPLSLQALKRDFSFSFSLGCLHNKTSVEPNPPAELLLSERVMDHGVD